MSDVDDLGRVESIALHILVEVEFDEGEESPLSSDWILPRDALLRAAIRTWTSIVVRLACPALCAFLFECRISLFGLERARRVQGEGVDAEEQRPTVCQMCPQVKAHHSELVVPGGSSGQTALEQKQRMRACTPILLAVKDAVVQCEL